MKTNKTCTNVYGESYYIYARSRKICFRENFRGSWFGMLVDFSTWTRKSRFCLEFRFRAVPGLFSSLRVSDCAQDTLSIMKFHRLRPENETFYVFVVHRGSHMLPPSLRVNWRGNMVDGSPRPASRSFNRHPTCEFLMSGFKGEEKTYAEPAITSQCARKFVWRKIELDQGLRKNLIFWYVHCFMVKSYFERVFWILG